MAKFLVILAVVTTVVYADIVQLERLAGDSAGSELQRNATESAIQEGRTRHHHFSPFHMLCKSKVYFKSFEGCINKS